MEKFKAGSVFDAVEKVKRLYMHSDVCMQELLEEVVIEGLSVSDTVRAYARLSFFADGDSVYRELEEGEREDLLTGELTETEAGNAAKPQVPESFTPQADNFMSKALLPHVGRHVEIVWYGTRDTVYDVCLEDLDTNEVIISAEDFADEEVSS